LRTSQAATLNDEDSMKPYIVFAALVALAPQALAQTRSTPPHPSDPAAKVPAVKYESAFAGYMLFLEEKLSPWREANDGVGKVRGHVGIFGGAGHAGHGGTEKAAPSKPATGKPAEKPAEPAGQAPARGAPKAAGEHKGH
jgi:hypothetical protein